MQWGGGIQGFQMVVEFSISVRDSMLAPLIFRVWVRLRLGFV